MSFDEKYKQILDLKQSGRKQQARALADELIHEYQSEPDEAFLLRMCGACTFKIDHLLWQRLVIPAITPRLESDPVAIKVLIQTIQNLYSDKETWRRLGYITEEQLIQKMLALSPEDTWARQVKIEQLQRWLAHSIHEWPSGILYATDGASVAECDAILSAVDELLILDQSADCMALCQDVREKVAQYKERLANNQ